MREAPLKRVERRSLSDAVFEQLRDQILDGTRAAGEALPPERALCEALGVNRGAVREALRRLEQARLVSIRHGGTSRVLDFRAHAGLDILGHLVLRQDGAIDGRVVRSIMELRSAIAPDAARRAALRRSESQHQALRAAASMMAPGDGDVADLQERALAFWSVLIDASDNLAYRLAYNAMRDTYDRSRALLAPVLESELRDAAAYDAIAAAVEQRHAAVAGELASDLVRRGEDAVHLALVRIEAITQENEG